MARRRVTGRAATVLVVVTAGLVGVQMAPSSAATADISTLLAQVPVYAEHVGGYDRDAFTHWIDADGNGCSTRDEVLMAESTVIPTIGSGCAVTGRWLSWYDGATWTNPSDVDIDHMVPLDEAWSSGAHVWTSLQRESFANDLGLDASLAAVTDNVNQSKGAKDPAEWLPPDPAAHCRYATEWVVVKYRWHLSADPAEVAALGATLDGCGDPTVTVPVQAAVPDAVPPGIPFPDVPAAHPFVAEISWLATAGMTTGYADGTFKPGDPVTRQAMAAYLWRYSYPGQTPPACVQPWFADVPVTHPFCAHVQWLARTGIASGYSDSTFRPSAAISRQAMAAFLLRYQSADAPTPAACTAPPFRDVPTSHPFCPAISGLVDDGITTGYADDSFRPTSPITRQAMAAFLYRFDAASGPSDPPIVITTPPTTTTTRPPTSPTTTGIPTNPGDTKNCSSFITWSQAQTWFDTFYPYYGDVARLDANGDGVACESLPGAP